MKSIAHCNFVTGGYGVMVSATDSNNIEIQIVLTNELVNLSKIEPLYLCRKDQSGAESVIEEFSNLEINEIKSSFVNEASGYKEGTIQYYIMTSGYKSETIDFNIKATLNLNYDDIYVDYINDVFEIKKVTKGYYDEIEAIKELLDDVQATADGKMTVFSETPIVPYKIGDLWWKDGKVLKCIVDKNDGEKFSESDWTESIYVDPDRLSETNKAVDEAQATADSKMVVFSETPTAPYKVGDLWWKDGKLLKCITAKGKDGVFAESDWSDTVYADQSQMEETKQSISNLQNTLDDEVLNLQNQIDGAIQFWNGPEVPTLNNAPASEWKTEEQRNNHRADIYTVIINDEQGKSYRFDKVNNTWKWVEITDNELSAVKALVDEAQATADSKMKVYSNIPTVPYKIGDLWWKGGKLYKCAIAKSKNETFAESDWVESVYADQDQLDETNKAVEDAQNTADSKMTVYSETPTTPYKIGDLWWENGKLYKCIVAKSNGESFSTEDWEETVYVDLDQFSTLKPTDESEGVELTLKNSAGLNTVDFKIDGNYHQETEPSPDYPSEVEVVEGDISVKNVAKNLLDYSKCENGGFNYLNGQNFDNVNMIRSRIFEVKPSTTYTLSCKESFGEVAYTLYDENQNIIKGYGKNTVDKSITFTTTETTKFIRLRVGYTNYPKNISNDYKLQLEENDVATEYEQYRGTITTLDLKGEFIGKLPNGVQDYLTVDNQGNYGIQKNAGRINLGELIWVYNSSYGFRANLTGAVLPPNNNTKANIICDNYTVYTANNCYALAGNITSGISLNNNNEVITRETNYNDAETYKNAIEGNFLYYELAEPYYVELGQAPIKTLEGNSTMNLLSNLETNMYCKYMRINDNLDAFQTKEDMGYYYSKSETDAQINTTANAVNLYATSLKELIDANGKTLSSLEKTVEQKIEDDKATFDIINNKIENGVENLKNTLVTIDIEGIKVATNTSKVSTVMTNNTFAIKNNANSYLAYFGYDENEKKSKAEMDNLKVTNYFTAGYHRTEKFKPDGIEKRTGAFFDGGDD